MAASDSSKDIIASLTKELYSQGGSLPLTKIAQFLNCVPKEASKWISKYSKYFKLFNTDHGEVMILGITKVSFCKTHASKPGTCLGCDSLHVCKFFVLGNSCKFGARCNFCHDFFENCQNQRILRKYHLQQLNPEELRCLFQKIENRCDVTVPTICKYFNHGACKKTDCICLHICKYYLMNECLYGKKCKINHNLDTRNCQILKMYGIPSTSISDALFKLRCLYDVENNSKEVDEAKPFSNITASPVIEDELICLHYLSFRCAFKNTCRHHHKEMPYQWQYKISNYESGEWQNFNEEWNELIEFKFCNLEKKTDITDTKKSTARIEFDTMRCFIVKQKYQLHRLSTVSYKMNSRSLLATTWIWYWKDDNASWMEYGSPNAGSISVTNEDIEKSYLDNPDGMMVIQIDDKCKAEIDFQKMSQKIKNKIREVMRRPKFISIGTAAELRKSPLKSISKLNLNNETQLKSFPSNWDLREDVTDTSYHYKVTEVDEMSREFKMISDQMNASMKNAEITNVERIENGNLWECYDWKKRKMAKETSGKDVKELKLFHGTEPEVIDAICKQGFDVRLSGIRVGSKYGKGTYFAKDANFAHNYIVPIDGKYQLFLVNVLIGEFVKGNPTYVRPPQKDLDEKGGKLYDSCVDNVTDPKLFVIFSNEQTYPAYIITYKIKD